MRKLQRSCGKAAEPIFIVGMNGSGTTMLADSLGRHPDLYSFIHETKLLPHIITRSSEYGDLADDDNFLRLWSDLTAIPGIASQTNKRQLSLPPNWRDWDRSCAGAINGLFSTLAMQKEGKARWCEKTPMHALHISLLADIFPKATFVHIIRDGRDCAASFHRRYKRTPEFTIYQWRKVISEARRQGAQIPERYLEVKFEDLTAMPEIWMKRICEFAGLPFSQEVLGSRRNPATNPGRDKIERNQGHWLSYFPKKTQSRLERISGATLVELGYETGNNLFDHDPPRRTLKWWALRGYMAQLLDEFSLQIKGHPYRTWPMFFRYLTGALKQIRTNRDIQ